MEHVRHVARHAAFSRTGLVGDREPEDRGLWGSKHLPANIYDRKRCTVHGAATRELVLGESCTAYLYVLRRVQRVCVLSPCARARARRVGGPVYGQTGCRGVCVVPRVRSLLRLFGFHTQPLVLSSSYVEAGSHDRLTCEQEEHAPAAVRRRHVGVWCTGDSESD